MNNLRPRRAAVELAASYPGAAISADGTSVTFPLLLPRQVQAASGLVDQIAERNHVQVHEANLRMPLGRVTFQRWSDPLSRFLDGDYGGMTGSYWLTIAAVAAIGLGSEAFKRRGSRAAPWIPNGPPPSAPPPHKPAWPGGPTSGEMRRRAETFGESYLTGPQMQSFKQRKGGRNRYTLAELQAMPTLVVGQADDLKVEKDGTRVWLARVGRAQGMPYDNMVSVQTFGTHGQGGRSFWKVIEEYQAL